MNNYLKNILFTLLLLQICVPVGSSQVLPANPPKKNFRVAVIYFKLANDVFEVGNITSNWPHTKPEPDWKNQLLIKRPYDSSNVNQLLEQSPGSITAYYYTMSDGKLWLYGDEVTYSGPLLHSAKSGNRSTRHKKWMENNTKIISWFTKNYEISKLDNNDDGSFDYVILVCRARPKFGYQGLGKLPINRITDQSGKIIRISGIYQTDCYKLHATRHIVVHEIGHSLGFGHINGIHRWCLMSGSGRLAPEASGVAMSAYEKHFLGWLDFDIVDKSTSGIRLGNITRINRAIRIPIKNSNNYFMLENRQYSQPFEPHPDDIDNPLHTIPGSGLLIYYVDSRGPHIIPADGNIRRVVTGKPPNNRIVFNGDVSDLFGKPNRTEVKLYTNPHYPNQEKKYTNTAIKNIQKFGDEMIFDIIIDKLGKIVTTQEQSSKLSLKNTLNPYSSESKIIYNLPNDSNVTLSIFDPYLNKYEILVSGFQERAEYEVAFKGNDKNAGIYLYYLKTDQELLSNKMLLMR